MFDFKSVNWAKVLKGTAIAAGGAALTYLSQWASGASFGVLTPLITAALSAGINFLRKLSQGEKG